MLTRIFSSSYPAAIDTDDQLPVIVDNFTQIDAFHINALKDSIIAIEKTLGINPEETFITVKDRVANINDKFVNVNGDIMTGNLVVNNSSVSRVFFGSDKQTAVLWPSEGASGDSEIYDVAPLSSEESLTVVPLTFVGRAADGTTKADVDLTTAGVVKTDIFDNFPVDVIEPTQHRRIRLFNDVDVQGYWHNKWALIAKNIVIDSADFPSVDNLYDDNAAILAGGALVVNRNFSIDGNFDAIGADKIIAWKGENKPVHTASSGTEVVTRMISAEDAALTAQNEAAPYPRKDVIAAAYPIGWGNVVTIPANPKLKGLLILFSSTLVGPGRVMLRINEGDSLTQVEDLSGRLDWPRLENLSLYPFDARSDDGLKSIIVNDIYTVSGQAVIPIGDVTQGTIWINEGESAFPAEQPMVDLDHEASFDPTKDHTIAMYYDYGWTGYDGSRWKYFNDPDQKVLYHHQHSQIFVYGFTDDNFNFNVKRLPSPINWDLLDELFEYSTLDELREAWNVVDFPPDAEISIGSVKLFNRSTTNRVDLNKNVGRSIGSDITLALGVEFHSLPETVSDGSLEVHARGSNSLYSIFFAKDGLYVNDATNGMTKIPDSEQYIQEDGKLSRWHMWFVDLDNDEVQITRIYRNNELIYGEDASITYRSTGNFADGDVHLINEAVSNSDEPIDVRIGYIRMGSVLAGYGDGYDYDAYGPYGY